MMPINLDSLCAELQKVRREIVNDISAVLRAVTRQDSRGRVDPSETETASPNYCVWYKDPAAGVWTISLPPNPDKVFSVAHCVGLSYIQVILRACPKELSPSHVQALAGIKDSTEIISSAVTPSLVANVGGDGTADDRLTLGISDFETRQHPFDRTALAQIHKQLKDIEASLDEAERNHDQAQRNRLTGDKEELLKNLKAAFGKQNRQRPMSSHEGAARDAVRRGVGRAIDMILRIDADAGRFLRLHIKTSWKCSYTGPEFNKWRFYK